MSLYTIIKILYICGAHLHEPVGTKTYNIMHDEVMHTKLKMIMQFKQWFLQFHSLDLQDHISDFDISSQYTCKPSNQLKQSQC